MCVQSRTVRKQGRHKHEYTYLHACVHTHMPTRIRTGISSTNIKYTCIHSRIHTYTHTYSHTYIRIPKHKHQTYIHTYAHTRRYSKAQTSTTRKFARVRLVTGTSTHLHRLPTASGKLVLVRRMRKRLWPSRRGRATAA